jgi:hypothetical protein
MWHVLKTGTRWAVRDAETTFGPDICRCSSEDRAHLIAHRVNCHDELLEACRNLDSALTLLNNTRPEFPEQKVHAWGQAFAAQDRARDAIAKAERKEP